MSTKQVRLKKLRALLRTQLTTTRIEIARSEFSLRKLKQKKSKLEAEIAKVNGELVKFNNGGRDLPIFFDDTKGMI